MSVNGVIGYQSFLSRSQENLCLLPAKRVQTVFTLIWPYVISSERHPGRFKKWLSDVVVPQTFDFLCGRANSPSSLFSILDAAPVVTPPPTQPTEQPPPTPAFPGAVPAASNLIQRNLTEFWTNFQPDLPDIDDPRRSLGRNRAENSTLGYRRLG